MFFLLKGVVYHSCHLLLSLHLFVSFASVVWLICLGAFDVLAGLGQGPQWPSFREVTIHS